MTASRASLEAIARRLCTWFIVLLIAGTSAPAWAQGDESMNKMLDEIGAQKGKGFDKSPVGKPTGAEANLKVHWKQWKRHYAAKEAGEESLAALLADGRSIGRTNQLEHAMAVASLAAGIEDYDVGRKTFAGAQNLAPQLPYPYLLESAWAFGKKPERLPHWVKPWIAGVKAGSLWLDTSYPWLLKLLSYLLIALTGASLVFIFGQFMRNFGIVAYDFARILPSGFSSNQSTLVLAAIITVPGLMMKSPLVSLFIILLMCTIVQTVRERIISVLVFAFIAALPMAEDNLSNIATYPESLAQKMLHAQWIECDAGCREDFDQLVAANPDDPYIKYTALLGAYREGSRASLSRVIEEAATYDWPSELIGHAHNLQGAALVARAKPKEALKVLQLARDEVRGSAAAPFNMMRAQQMLDDESAAAAALKEAGSRDIETVTVYLDIDRRDVNSFLIVEPIPLRTLWPYQMHHPDPERSVATLRPVWELVAGEGLDFSHTTPIGLVGALFALFGFGISRRTSKPCPRCGQARDPSEERKTGNHAYCVPCYSTYITGATLDYDARVHNEKVLGRRELFNRVLRRFGGFVIPGLGHQVAGHAVSGFLISSLLLFCAAIILNPLGIVRAPHELVGTNWSAQITLSWVIVSLCALSLLGAAKDDLEPVGLRERGGR